MPGIAGPTHGRYSNLVNFIEVTYQQAYYIPGNFTPDIFKL